MRQALDRFILAIPVLLIKQFPYAWIVAVVFWSWPPAFSIVFLAIVVLGLGMLRWQSIAWLSNLKREHAWKDGKFHVDESPFLWQTSARKVLFLLAGAAGLAWLLDGQFGLSFWQFFAMIFGFTLFYQDTRFFGAPSTYVVTDEGIGIRFVSGHLDYRLFLSFKEISRVEKREHEQDKGWDLFARMRDANEGLLLVPKNPNGFTKRIGKLFIVPSDREGFLEQLPQGYTSIATR
jgi:hypothetical protein